MIITWNRSYLSPKSKSIKFYCYKLWNDTFKNNGITIDNDVTNNAKFDQIDNIHQLKRVLIKLFLYSYSLE